jgi:hypothetical protein
VQGSDLGLSKVVPQHFPGGTEENHEETKPVKLGTVTH